MDDSGESNRWKLQTNGARTGLDTLHPDNAPTRTQMGDSRQIADSRTISRAVKAWAGALREGRGDAYAPATLAKVASLADEMSDRLLEVEAALATSQQRREQLVRRWFEFKQRLEK